MSDCVKVGVSPRKWGKSPEWSGEEARRGRSRDSGFTKTPGFSSHDSLVRQTIQNPVEGCGE